MIAVAHEVMEYAALIDEPITDGMIVNMLVTMKRTKRLKGGAQPPVAAVRNLCRRSAVGRGVRMAPEPPNTRPTGHPIEPIDLDSL